MPFVEPVFSESPVFLYPSVRDAQDRKGNGGGSGFLVGIQSKAHPAFAHLYAVSNHHVCLTAPVLRIPQSDGSTRIVDGTFDDDWTEHENGDDVAVRSLGTVPVRDYNYIDESALLTRDHIQPRGIGPGDECLMVGRFVNRGSEVLDQSVVRFGNLAMLPAPVWQRERAFSQESFLVDMRSVAGFSGSQVIVYYAVPGQPTRAPEDPLYLHGPREVMGNAWLLGIDWGHLFAWGKVLDEQNQTIGRMQVNNGMAGVVPAWKLAELLHDPRVESERDKAEAELAKPDEFGAELDTLEQSGEFERFEDLTDRLLRVPKKELDEKLAET